MLDEDLIQHLKPSAGVVPVRWPYEPTTDDHMRDDEVVDALEPPPRGPMTRLELLVAVLCALLFLAPVVYVAGLW